MMKKVCALLVFIALAMPLLGQSREDILVHVAPVTAARPDHASFFKQNFDLETSAAGYSLTENIQQADYVLRLDVRPNLVMYDDGFEEPAPPDEPQFLLHVTLEQTEDNVDMVAFSFPFTELEEMYDFNLYLLYQAMATVPLTRLGDIAILDDLWRHKWLYVRGSFDFTIPVNQAPPNFFLYTVEDEYDRIPIYDEVMYYPGLTLGIEYHYLNWMSTELILSARFGLPGVSAFNPGLGLQVKFPIKPERNFKISPYVMAQAQLSAPIPAYRIPPYSVGGGVQFGVRGGPSGSIFVDANYMHTIQQVVRRNTSTTHERPAEIKYNRWVISLGIGFKYGFFDRPLPENED